MCRPRIGFFHFNKLASMGGPGLPDLKGTIWQLTWGLFFLKAKESIGWIQIEGNYVTPFFLKDVIWNRHVDRQPSIICNPFLSHTLTIWDITRKILAPDVSPVSSFLGQSWFTPDHSPRSFPNWCQKGLTHFCNVSNWGDLLSRLGLEEKYKNRNPLAAIYVNTSFILSFSYFAAVKQGSYPFWVLVKKWYISTIWVYFCLLSPS